MTSAAASVKTVDQMILDDPTLRHLVIEMAVDYAWSVIDGLSEEDGDFRGGDGVIWSGYKLSSEGLREAKAEIALLIRLGLATRHPRHKHWIREIAEL